MDKEDSVAIRQYGDLSQTYTSSPLILYDITDINMIYIYHKYIRGATIDLRK